MHINKEESMAELFARRVGNVSMDRKSWQGDMLLFSMSPSELAAAISYRPAIADELRQASGRSELMAVVWSRAKAGMAVAAAAAAFDEVLLASTQANAQHSSKNQ